MKDKHSKEPLPAEAAEPAATADQRSEQSAPRPNVRLKPLMNRRDVFKAGAAAAMGLGLAAQSEPASAMQGMSKPEQMYHPAMAKPGVPPRQKQVFSAPGATPPRPWAKWVREWPRPGEPWKDYNPVFTPNGSTLPYRIDEGGVKVFHLIAEEVVQEITPGLFANVWGYNGQVPGPTLEAVEGDRVRIYVTNHLPVRTSVHWHGILLPCGMDGVSGVTQPAIMPGKTGVYEFIMPEPGTFMYHPHFDNMTQEGMGLTGMQVIHPRGGERRPNRDFVIMLHEWRFEVGVSRPNPFVSTDFNILTMNGVSFPHTYPLVAELGDTVRIRFGNLSPMDHHPIHLHGYTFRVVGTGAGRIPESAQYDDVTVLVPVGSVREIEFLADNPGDWIMHCHMTHHTMNEMGHDIPNMVGVEVPQDLEAKLGRVVPGYMTMGQKGMEGMADMDMPVPENSAPMVGFEGQFGPTVLGGMVTLVKVRQHAPSYEDPGLFDFPDGTVMAIAEEDELERDEIHVARRSEAERTKRGGGWQPDGRGFRKA